MMYRKILRSKVPNMLFFVAVLCLTLNLLTYQALDLAEYKNILRYIGIGGMILTVLYGNRKINWKIGIVAVLVYATIIVVSGKGNLTGNAINIVAIIMVMLSAQIIEYNDLLKIFFRVAVISIIVWFLLLAVGAIAITPWEAYRVSGWGTAAKTIVRTRYSLGFLYEINLGAWYLTTAISVILLSKGISIVKVSIITLIAVGIYVFTDSRTTFGFYVIFIVSYMFLYVSRNKGFITSFLKKIVGVVYAGLFIIPFMSSILMRYVPFLDRFFSGRLSGLVSRMEEMTAFNYLFGWYYSPLACFYYLLYSQFGIFVYLYFFYVVQRGSSYYLKKNEYLVFSFLFSLAFVGLVEGSIFAVEELSTLVFWSLIGKSFCGRSNIKTENKEHYEKEM